MWEGLSLALLDAAVVLTVTVAVPLPPAVMVTLAGLTLQIGRLTAPDGLDLRLHVRFMVP
jgi:hypothetical protein